jgi:hypothetical protein
MSLFPLLGLLVGAYTIYAIVTGSVYAKSGPGGRLVSRAESPEYFWVVIAIYAGLTFALFFLF